VSSATSSSGILSVCKPKVNRSRSIAATAGRSGAGIGRCEIVAVHSMGLLFANHDTILV
jgi:hypothetical protein